jgi:hypothetical protein
MNNTNLEKIKAEFLQEGFMTSHHHMEDDILKFQDVLEAKIANPIKNAMSDMNDKKSLFFKLQNRYNILQKVFEEKYLLYDELKTIERTENAMNKVKTLEDIYEKNYAEKQVNKIPTYGATKPRSSSFSSVFKKIRNPFGTKNNKTRSRSFGGKRNKTRKH